MNEELNKKDISNQKDTDLNTNTGLVLKAVEDKKNISKRTEKIVAALYLISGLIPENDPLRTSLRGQSIELLSLTNSSLRLGITDTRNFVIENVVSKIDYIISLMKVGLFSGYLSEMNFKILRDEMESFVEYMKKDALDLPIHFVLPEGFLESRTSTMTQAPAYKTKNEIKDSSFYKGQETTKNSKFSGPKPTIGADITKNANKDSRRNSILELLKKNGEMTIKDISSNFDDCSEKTIQRELISLIESKLIKRKGERRWSVYSLNRS